MTTLVRHSAVGAAELLARFQSFANGPPPAHPSRPSLKQEREFAKNLVAGNPQTLAAIEGVLDGKDQASEAGLDESSRSAINALCDEARRFEEC